jgi:hypothetical protein
VGNLAGVALCVLTVGSNPVSDIVSDKVDLIEINHCYDENGQLVFDQLLFYDWSPSKARYDVRDWRLIKSPVQVPRKNHENGGYVVLWRDGATMRRIHAETVRETWTQHDPEITEQQFLAKSMRRSFAKLSPQQLSARRNHAESALDTADRSAQDPSTPVRR